MENLQNIGNFLKKATGGSPSVTEKSDESDLSDSHFSSDDISRSFDEPWRPKAQDQKYYKQSDDPTVKAQFLKGKQADDPTIKAQVLRESPLLSPSVKILENLTNEEDKYAVLEMFYKNNFEKVEAYDKLLKDLINIMANHMPGVNIDENYSPTIITTLINFYIDELKARFRKYQLEIGDLGIKTKEMFAGAEIAAKIQQHQKNLFALLETYESDLATVREENVQLKDNRTHLEAQIDYLQTRIFYLERGTMYHGQLEESMISGEVDKGKLMAELKSRNAYNERLNSSLKEELNVSQSNISQAQRQMDLLKKKLSVIEEESLWELSKISQKAEINSIVEEALMSIVKDKGGLEKPPNIEECRNVIETWTRLIREAIADSGKKLEKLVAEASSTNAKLVEKENELKNVKEKLQEVDQQVNVLNESCRLKLENAKQLSETIESLVKQIEISSAYDEELKKLYEERKRQYDANMDQIVPGMDNSRSSGSADQSNISSELSEQFSASSPGIKRNYQQFTKFDRVIPTLITPHIINEPLALNKTSNLSPKTPFIPKSRFGYTDPEAAVLNIPPRFQSEGESVRKTIFLTSPERGEQQLQVDIDVQPRPLIQTETGEHFVCDISFNMQEVSSEAQKTDPQQGPSSFIPNWHHTPPIAKSVDRRHHGMFTPRNVFEKGYYAKRNLYKSDYESPESPWGTGKRFHPEYDDYETENCEKNILPPINQTIELEKTPFDSTFVKPRLDGTSIKLQLDKTGKSRLDKTFLQTRLYKTVVKPRLDRTAVKPRLDRAEKSRLDRTFEKPRLDRTVVKTRPDRTFVKPRPDRTFVKPQLDRSEKPRLDKNFEKPRLDKTFVNPRFERTFIIRSPQFGETISICSSDSSKRFSDSSGRFSTPRSSQPIEQFSRSFSPERTPFLFSSTPKANSFIQDDAQDWMSLRQGPEMFSSPERPFSISPRNRLQEESDQDWLNQPHGPEMFSLSARNRYQDQSDQNWLNQLHRYQDQSDQDQLNQLQGPEMFSPSARNRYLDGSDQDWLNQRHGPEMFSPQARNISQEQNDQDWLNQVHGPEMFSPQARNRVQEQKFQDWLNQIHLPEMVSFSTEGDSGIYPSSYSENHDHENLENSQELDM